MKYRDSLNNNHILTKCDCGCSFVDISTIEEIKDEYFVNFYYFGNGNYIPLKQKLKIIKDVLLNRQICISEFILKKDKLKQFAKDILSITEDNSNHDE